MEVIGPVDCCDRDYCECNPNPSEDSIIITCESPKETGVLSTAVIDQIWRRLDRRMVGVHFLGERQSDVTACRQRAPTSRLMVEWL